MQYDYEYIVIGAGPGGLTVAIGLGASGKDVLMIEKGEIGGDCTNHGCVPSKALLYAAKSDNHHTLEDAMQYVREQRQHIRDEETPDILAQYGVKTRFGVASFVDRHTIRLMNTDQEESLVTAKNVIICTGAKARTIDIDGADDHDVLTNETLFELEKPIDNLVILGGGVISCEMAEAFARLGTTVTIIEKYDEVISREDPDVSVLMHEHLVGLGVTILTGSGADHCEVRDENKVILTACGREVIYDKILLTIGRVPLINALQLDHASITYTKKGIVTDQYSKTSVRSIYAIGDCVAGNPNFTHWANNQGRILVQNLLTAPFLGRHRWNTKQGHPLPWTIYTSQEIAKVGLNQKEAEARYDDAVVTRVFPFAKNDRSKVEQTTGGLIKLIFKRLSLKLVGVVIVAPNAGELLPQYTIAMKHNIGLLGLMKVIYQYPTRSEIIKLALDEYMLKLTKERKQELKWVMQNILNGRVLKAL